MQRWETDLKGDSIMKSKMFVLALVTAAGSAFAQNTIVNNIPGTYVDISALPGAVGLTNGVTADDVSYVINSSVTNSVFASTTVRVCTNGFLQFGGAAGSTTWTNVTIAAGTNSPVGTATTQALMPYWDDMRFRAATGDELYWIEGPAESFGLPAALGNVLIIQWNAVGHYDATAGGSDFSVGDGSYQVQIYSNVVNNVAAQMLYSDVVWDNPAMDNGVSATVGFAAGTTGGPQSLSNVLYSFNQAGSITNGMVLSLTTATAPYPPTAIGAASPANSQPGDNVVFTATVTPGGNPDSSGLGVVGNLASVGGPAAAVFHDDGLNGDASAGDNIFSYSFVIPGDAPGGGYSVPVTVSDAQARSSNANIVGSIFNPVNIGEIGAGSGGSEVVTTIDVGIAPGAISWYIFSIGADVLNGSTNYLDIDTEPSAPDGAPAVGSINDTELGTYTSDGTFLDFDDDDGTDFHSQLTYGDNTNIRPPFGNAAVAGGNGRDGDLSTGTYYLAVGCYNVIFADGFVATTGSTAAGTVQVNFRTNIPGGGTGPCSAADVGVAGGEPGQDNLLDNNDFIAFINFFFAQDPIADQGQAGGEYGSDGLYDNNDFIAFINHFFEDAAGCNG